MALFNNLQHVQVAPWVDSGTPVFIDVPGSTEFTPNVTANKTEIDADGMVYTTLYDAPVLEADLKWVESDFAVNVILNGGEATTSGTGTSIIKRWEMLATPVSPTFTLAAFMPNVRSESQSAGLRVTLPRAKSGPATVGASQKTVGEWSASISATGDENNWLMIYEDLATAPTFTTGVMPVNLDRPAT